MKNAALLAAILALSLPACAQCPVETVIVTGYVNNAVPHSKVRVHLLYPKGKAGESGEVTVDAEASASRSNSLPLRIQF